MPETDTFECRLCGKLLLYKEGTKRSIRDLVPGGYNPKLCRKCEKDIVVNYLLAKGVFKDPATNGGYF